MKSSKGRRGQFVIIAVMLSAIMIISIGALMHSAMTYYKHEPWEEYTTMIGDIEINSRKIVELSLASYTKNDLQDKSILTTNLKNWKNDLTDIYPSNGIVLTHYSEVIEKLWSSEETSTSIASAEFDLDIKSIGLEGYNFKIVVSLSLTIIDNGPSPTVENAYETLVVVRSETGLPVSGLDKDNFWILGAPDNRPVSVTLEYDGSNTLQYRILHYGPSNPQVEVCDQRFVRVVGSTS